MATFKGLACFWGVDGITYTGFGTTSGATRQTQSADLTVTSDRKEIRDGDGCVKSIVYYNHNRTLDLEITPTGTSQALAATASDETIMPAGTKLIVRTTATGQSTGTGDGSEIDSDTGDGAAGAYVVQESSLSRSNESEAKISVTLYRNDVNEIATDDIS